MDASTTTILVLVGLLAANQAVLRVAGLRGHPVVFWGLQVVNLAAGTFSLAWGIPGLEGMPIFSWFIGLFFFFRIVQNNMARAAFLREASEEEDTDARKQAMHDALRRGGDS